MEFILPLILSVFGGLFSGGIQQNQQNRQARAEAEAERERLRVQSELAAQERARIQAEVEGYMNELAEFSERVRRGAEYSGLEAGASREASRNVAASNAAASMAGIGDSGAAQSAAGAIMADAIGQTAMARLQDQLQREGLIGDQEAQLRGVVAQLLRDPAFRIGDVEQNTAGIDQLLAGLPSAFGSSVAGGVGAALPILGQWALGEMSERYPNAFGANAAATKPVDVVDLSGGLRKGGAAAPPGTTGYVPLPASPLAGAPALGRPNPTSSWIFSA